MRIVRLLIIGLSLVVGASAVGVLLAVAGTPRTPLGWAWGVLAFVLGFLITRVTLSLGLNTSAAFEKGMTEAASESRGAAYEATGRRAGAVVGKGLNKVARIGAPRPPSTPSPKTPPTTAETASGAPDTAESSIADSSSEKPDITVDKAARVIGSMVGRRVAQRRNKP